MPPPRSHLVRYFGVFAPRSAIRATILPKPSPEPQPEAGQMKLPLPREPRERRLPWADLLRRVFGDDLLRCPCGGRRKVVAFIPSGKMAKEILAAVGIEAAPLVVARAQAPPHQESFDLPVDYGSPDHAYPD